MGARLIYGALGMSSLFDFLWSSTRGGDGLIGTCSCVLGEMFMRKPILPGTSDIDQLEKIWQLCGTPNQHTWPNFDALPGCEGVKRFQNYPKKLKSTFNR